MQLLNADGTVKESWQTANPMGPNDRLWIGSTSGNIYFDMFPHMYMVEKA